MATGGNVPDPNKPRRTTAPAPTKPAKPAPAKFAPKGKKK
jgi:hypothetical protein